MLHIKNIRLLSKVQGIFDKIDVPEFLLKITIDEAFFFPEVVGTTEKNQVFWGEETFPLIELTQTQNDYTLTFIVYRNGVLIGTAKTSIKYGQSLKEQNDVISSTKSIAAKILYQCEWYSKVPPGMVHITNQQFLAFKYNNAKGGNKPKVATETVTQKYKPYVRQEADEDCGGFCGCFGSRKKKRPSAQVNHSETQSNHSYKKQLKTQNKVKINVEPQEKQQADRRPFLYSDAQLGGVNQKRSDTSILQNQETKRLTYFSRTYFLSR